MQVALEVQQRVFADLRDDGVLEGGFFQVDAEGRVVDLDAHVRKLWCLQVGQPWYEASFDPEQARRWFFETVGRGHTKVPMRTTMLLTRCPTTSEGRSYFWGRLFFYPADPGWLGYVLDRTGDEVCRRLQHVPVGFYVVARDPEGVERVVYATQGFADLYQFPSVEAAIGTPIERLFRHQESYEKFLHELRTRTPRRLQGWKNETRTIRGEPRHISADIAWRLEGEGEDAQVTERYGILRDLTKSEFYTTYLRDYAVVLHTYSNALLEMLNALNVLKIPMLPDPFRGRQGRAAVLETEDVHRWFRSTRHPVVAALRDLLAQAEARGLSQHVEVQHMRRYYERLLHLDETPGFQAPLFIASVHLEIGSRILRRTQRLREQRPRHGPWFSKEILRRVRATAWDMVRIASLLVIYPLEERLIEIGDEIRLFREFWNTPLRRYQPQPIDLVDVLEGVLQALSDFAQSRGVRWKRHEPWPRAAWVYADPAALRRALSHLVHNAVKYSWQRASGTWVALRLSQEPRADRAGWLLEIENYGVPIPPDELRDGTIFQFGYRGRLAPDRHRLGTGIGLYDAYRIIRDLEGDLSLTSDPASPIAPGEDPLYEVDPATGERKLRPHLVRARVWLPAIAQS